MAKRGFSDDDLIWQGSPSQWVNVRWTLFLVVAVIASLWLLVSDFRGAFGSHRIGLLSLLPVAVALPCWGWMWLVVRHTRFYLLKERIIIERGVLNRTTNQVELYRMRDYRVEETILNRLVGIGTVRLWTVDRNEPQFMIPGVNDPRELQELIRNTKHEYVGITQQVEIG